MAPLPPNDVLLERLRAHDREAFAAMVTAWSPGLRRLARTFVRSEAVADEVVQETWLGVVRGLPSFEGRSSLKTWVYRILTNRSKTRGEREARMKPLSALGDDGDSVDADRFHPDGSWANPVPAWQADAADEVLFTKESFAVVREALDALPARQRAVVQLCDVDGLDPEEVCNLLDITMTNQRVLLHRGRSALRAALERHLGRG